MSITAEMYRINTSACSYDPLIGHIASDPERFPYNGSITCNLVCSDQIGPFSPIRGGSASNIYVIPAPTELPFGAAMLLALVSSIPAALKTVSLFSKISNTSKKTPLDLTNSVEAAREIKLGASIDIRVFLMSSLEIHLFGGAALAILVLGERNFASPQVAYQTETMANFSKDL